MGSVRWMEAAPSGMVRNDGDPGPHPGGEGPGSLDYLQLIRPTRSSSAQRRGGLLVRPPPDGWPAVDGHPPGPRPPPEERKPPPDDLAMAESSMVRGAPGPENTATRAGTRGPWLSHT